MVKQEDLLGASRESNEWTCEQQQQDSTMGQWRHVRSANEGEEPKHKMFLK